MSIGTEKIGIFRVPPHATHYQYSYGIMSFWCKIENGRGIESGEQFYCWAYYDGENWIKDVTVCSRHFKTI